MNLLQYFITLIYCQKKGFIFKIEMPKRFHYLFGNEFITILFFLKQISQAYMLNQYNLGKTESV